MIHPSTALLIATMDTKGREALFISACLKRAGISVRIMDAGIRGNSPAPVDVSRTEVARAGGKSLAEVQNIGHEGKALVTMRVNRRSMWSRAMKLSGRMTRSTDE